MTQLRDSRGKFIGNKLKRGASYSQMIGVVNCLIDAVNELRAAKEPPKDIDWERMSDEISVEFDKDEYVLGELSKAAYAVFKRHGLIK